jgi:hypothetical protein
MSYYDDENWQNAYDAVYQFNLLHPADEVRSPKSRRLSKRKYKRRG